MDPSISIVLMIITTVVVLLVFEVVRIDLVAMICMLSLGWSGVLTPQETFSGFSSNAVIAMMAVMIMGRGISKTGIMDRFSRAVLQKSGTKRSRIIGLMSLSVGILSGFIQNIGAVALFLPGVLNIARRGKIPASTLIMPIGFAAILGGTLSMVGSGPLILINDLLRNAGMEPFGLFSVTPVGILLLGSGIAYFSLLQNYVLPHSESSNSPVSEQDRLIEMLNLPHDIRHYIIPGDSSLIGSTPEQSGLWDLFRLHVLGISRDRNVEYSPWRDTRFEGGQELALLGEESDIIRFAAAHALVPEPLPARFASLSDPGEAGFAEVIIPPRSELAGRTIRGYSLRKRYAVEPVMLFSKGEAIHGDFSDRIVNPGDTFVVYGLWDRISDLRSGSDFVVITPFTMEKKERSKAPLAVLCFLAAIGLALSGSPISMAFFSGAAAMVLLRVISIQDAYQAIEWKVVFLIAGLIPLGIAMQKTEATVFLAEKMMVPLLGIHPVFLLIAVGVLSTLFSLLMSNVGAIVVLAPLVISMARIKGLDPRPLVLMAAVCAANSFILPTHQVNALLMSSGGYRNSDYIRAGGGMTLVFLTVAVTVFYCFYF